MQHVIKAELLKADYMAIDKKSLLKEMTDFLYQKKFINSSDPFFDAVWARETVISTGIGRALALPHACHQVVNELSVAFWQLKEPIPFEAIDDKPVKLVFMVAVPPDKKADYMKVLAAVSAFCRVPENIEYLSSNKTPAELYNYITKIKIDL